MKLDLIGSRSPLIMDLVIESDKLDSKCSPVYSPSSEITRECYTEVDHTRIFLKFLILRIQKKLVLCMYVFYRGRKYEICV